METAEHYIRHVILHIMQLTDLKSWQAANTLAGLFCRKTGAVSHKILYYFLDFHKITLSSKILL